MFQDLEYMFQDTEYIFHDVEQRNEAAFGCFTSMCTRFLAVLLPYFSFLHFCFDWKTVFNDWRQILANWCGLWHLPVMVNWWLVARCFVRLLFLLLCPIYRKFTLDMWTMLKRCCFGRKLFVQLWFSLYLCTVLLQYVLRYKVSLVLPIWKLLIDIRTLSNATVW